MVLTRCRQGQSDGLRGGVGSKGGAGSGLKKMSEGTNVISIV